MLMLLESADSQPDRRTQGDAESSRGGPARDPRPQMPQIKEQKAERSQKSAAKLGQ